MEKEYTRMMNQKQGRGEKEGVQEMNCNQRSDPRERNKGAGRTEKEEGVKGSQLWVTLVNIELLCEYTQGTSGMGAVYGCIVLTT